MKTTTLSVVLKVLKAHPEGLTAKQVEFHASKERAMAPNYVSAVLCQMAQHREDRPALIRSLKPQPCPCCHHPSVIYQVKD
jgi:hypothetical protein